MAGELILLDDRPDIKELLIAFALFSLNYERLIDQIRSLCLAISPTIGEEERTGGGWIHLAHKLITNNLQTTEESHMVWDDLRKNMWEMNKERIRILKGAKFYEISEQGGTWLVTYSGGNRSTTNFLSAEEIYEAEKRCRKLELAIEHLVKCIQQGVEISKVISRVGDDYVINLYYLQA